VTITPGPNAHDVDPLAHVMVKANAWTLTDVRVVNDGGKPVDGVMTPDNTVWKPTVLLGCGHTYKLTVTSRGRNGVASMQVSSFSTLLPSNQTKVSFTTTSEATLREGGTYGVGTVVVAHFDEQIADRAAAERQLTVTTNPPVHGSCSGSTTRTPIGDQSTTTHRARQSLPKPRSTEFPWAVAHPGAYSGKKTAGYRSGSATRTYLLPMMPPS
jgi:Bacterial Ig domain